MTAISKYVSVKAAVDASSIALHAVYGGISAARDAMPVIAQVLTVEGILKSRVGMILFLIPTHTALAGCYMPTNSTLTDCQLGF
jgi:hypothetical protein